MSSRCHRYDIALPILRDNIPNLKWLENWIDCQIVVGLSLHVWGRGEMGKRVKNEGKMINLGMMEQ